MSEFQPEIERKEKIIRKILIVDDDEVALAVAVGIAEMMGYKTITANSATEAVHILLETEDIDALLTDFNMPGGMNGLELIERLRQQEKFQKLPMILQTAAGSKELEERAKKLKSAFLHKPVREEDFQKALEIAVKKSEQ